MLEVITVVVLVCELSRQLTHFHEIRYEMYCTRHHPKTVLCLDLESSITTWRTGERFRQYGLLYVS